LAENDTQRQVLALQFTAFELGRPYFLPEGVPADRVQVLRRAFDETMKDKDLLADAEKQGLEVNPATGEEMMDMLKKVYATPKDVIARLGEATKDTPDLKVLTPEKKEGAKSAQ
jgi:tripartite-type tricarboxylate transporter receptor subunit TctC